MKRGLKPVLPQVRSSPVAERSLQLNYLSSHRFHVGVESQGSAKAFQRGQRIVHSHVALPHARGGGEMVRVDFQRLAAIAHRIFVRTDGEMGDCPLIPDFRKPGRLLDQFCGAADRFAVVL